MIVAVDGPTASGKGTIAKALAEHFGLPVLDTGLLYRAVGYQTQLNHGDPDKAADALAACDFPDTLLDDPSLRNEETGGLASRVSVHPPVRDALFERQRAFATQAGGAILDGRDIGTVIAPEAEAKLFVTASVEARAQRRFLEMRERGVRVTLLEIADDLRRRDERDRGRTIAPLIPAEDAMVLDTSSLGRDEAIEAAIEAVERMAAAAGERAGELGLKVVAERWVPGALECPLALQQLLARDDVAGAVLLGIIERGETQHGLAMGQAVVQAVLDLAVERFGPVDLYVANAGVGLGQGLESSEEDWSTSLDVNVMAHVRAARLLVPGWLERGRGYFLSTASAAGLLTQIGSPTYSVTKHAAVAFAEWLSVTYGTRGIAVSCLCPMGVNTAMLNGGADSDDPTARQGARAVTEAGGVLEPLDVADVVLDAIDDERFLVLPHPEVLEFYRRKASDYDRWLAGMRRYQDTLA